MATDQPTSAEMLVRLAGALAELGVTRVDSAEGTLLARDTDLPAVMARALDAARRDGVAREFVAIGVGITITVEPGRIAWRADSDANRERFSRVLDSGGA